MRAVIQKVKNANVKVDGDTVGEIQKGFLIFLGIEAGDTQSDLAYIVGKISKIRIFEDADDKMNLSIKDVGGEVLSISQFTLLGDARKGNRPSFTGAEKPEKAKEIYLKLETLEDIYSIIDEMIVEEPPITITEGRSY